MEITTSMRKTIRLFISSPKSSSTTSPRQTPLQVSPTFQRCSLMTPPQFSALTRWSLAKSAPLTQPSSQGLVYQASKVKNPQRLAEVIKSNSCSPLTSLPFSVMSLSHQKKASRTSQSCSPQWWKSPASLKRSTISMTNTLATDPSSLLDNYDEDDDDMLYIIHA